MVESAVEDAENTCRNTGRSRNGDRCKDGPWCTMLVVMLCWQLHVHLYVSVRVHASRAPKKTRGRSENVAGTGSCGQVDPRPSMRRVPAGRVAAGPPRVTAAVRARESGRGRRWPPGVSPRPSPLGRSAVGGLPPRLATSGCPRAGPPPVPPAGPRRAPGVSPVRVDRVPAAATRPSGRRRSCPRPRAEPPAGPSSESRRLVRWHVLASLRPVPRRSPGGSPPPARALRPSESARGRRRRREEPRPLGRGAWSESAAADRGVHPRRRPRPRCSGPPRRHEGPATPHARRRHPTQRALAMSAGVSVAAARVAPARVGTCVWPWLWRAAVAVTRSGGVTLYTCPCVYDHATGVPGLAADSDAGAYTCASSGLGRWHATPDDGHVPGRADPGGRLRTPVH
jgi:hypothetical protein